MLVLSQQPEAVVDAWLDGNNIRVDEIVRETDLLRFGLRLTPSILLVDRAGAVAGTMFAQLSAAEELQVIEYLAGRGEGHVLNNVEHVDVVSASRAEELRELPLVLDIRERDAVQRRGPDDRVNIPLVELSVRAPMELSTSDRILVDCSVVSVNRCRRASDVLRESGFMKVTLLAD